MGNMYSTNDVPGASPVDTSAQSGQPSTPSHLTEPPSIESIEQPAGQQSGYRVDPFGPMTTTFQTPSLATGPANPEPPSILPDPPPPPEPEPPISIPSDAIPQGNSAAALLARMPDIQQMMKDLEKSGCLLPELRVTQTHPVDTSPLAALQPHRLNGSTVEISSPSTEQPKPILPDIQLATTGAVKVQQRPKESVELPLYVFTSAICLIQAIQGFAQVIHFFFIGYPEYEQLVIAGVQTTADVNTAVVKALIIIGLSLTSLITLLVLLTKRSSNHSPWLYFSVVLIVLNFYTQNVMVAGQFASGSPLHLPEIIGEIISPR